MCMWYMMVQGNIQGSWVWEDSTISLRHFFSIHGCFHGLVIVPKSGKYLNGIAIQSWCQIPLREGLCYGLQVFFMMIAPLKWCLGHKSHYCSLMTLIRLIDTLLVHN